MSLDWLASLGFSICLVLCLLKMKKLDRMAMAVVFSTRVAISDLISPSFLRMKSLPGY